MRTYQQTAFTILRRYDIFYDVGIDFEIDMDFAPPQRCETFS
jgi:hypothetical protein